MKRDAQLVVLFELPEVLQQTTNEGTGHARVVNDVTMAQDKGAATFVEILDGSDDIVVEDASSGCLGATTSMGQQYQLSYTLAL